VEKLNAGIRLGRTLTIISAPAGSGKTTLLSEWATQCGRSVAWLSLDEEDNTLLGFLSDIIAALQKVVPSIGYGNVVLLESIQSPPIEKILDSLVNDIINAFSDTHTPKPSNPVFIFDDYHVVESSSIHRAMLFIIEHLTPIFHIIIAGRNQPSLPLARLRVRGYIAELDANDLRFSPAEARVFFCETADLRLSTQDTNTLQIRTEGWIAGMQIAALSLRGHQNPDSFIKTFSGSHHAIEDYFVDEVFKRQSPDIQEFMLQTSILDQLSGPLCDAVNSESSLRGRGGQEILEILERDNIFVIPLDDDRRWFRYHQLFAEFMRAHLEKNLADRIPLLELRAARWYEQNRMINEAIKYLTRADAMDQVARLVEDHADAMLTNGRIATLSRWIELVPEEFLYSHPRLALIGCLTDLSRGMPLGVVTHTLKCATQYVANPTSDLRGMVLRAELIGGARLE
jgi:LuxR family maltose regulon positive regulatory protein